MTAPTRSPRTRTSGGRTLILVGVLLALAAGMIVIFIVSQATAGVGPMVTVVVAKQDLKSGIILSATTSNSQHMLISDAFQTKSIPANDAPTNAFSYTSPEDLNTKLDNQVIVGPFYAGDILRQTDPRLVALGSAAPGSIANVNPGQFPSGDVLMDLGLQTPTGSTSGKPLAVAGDHIDIIVTGCNLPGSKDPNACETQTTLQNIYVYAVTGSDIIVVVTHQQSLIVQYLQGTGKAQIIVRKPGDDGTVTTTPVDGSYVVKDFGF